MSRLAQQFRCASLFCLVPIMSAGCVVESKHPLADPDQAALDNRLLGHWMRKEKDGSTSHTIFSKAHVEGIESLPAGLMSTYDFHISPNGEVAPAAKPSYFFSAKIGNEWYLHWLKDDLFDNAKFPKWNKTNIQSYIIFKYSIANDRLSMTVMDPTATAKTVEEGKLKGIVKRKKSNNMNQPKDADLQEVLLTDSTEALVRFLKNGGSEMLFLPRNALACDRVK